MPARRKNGARLSPAAVPRRQRDNSPAMLPNTPIPSFESPIELLTACHDKVRRFASLCGRLAEHTARHGADDQARTAAAGIVRYFTIAAPLHHADEETDLFPALRALGDDALTAAMRALEDDHDALDALWHQARPWLEAVQQGSAGAAPEALAEFAARYLRHVEREEREVFPFAARLPEPTLRAIGQRMAQRRGA
ncbi:hemerythrin domain-containing protein [Cupriavidus gilardii]|uniref:Hemerythrin domain-containing protein n=1 Tax=Cupriavidus gilardii TaxID=82541 RepID=A0ABY4VRL6_9BURK|nr:hemerythrin domain-containing protein [Cupriavidus gilardii]USE78644.1 hemerythrin domain-containing protein [Cupriavidus gilardii]